MGCGFDGRLNQSVPETHEANLGGTDSASHDVKGADSLLGFFSRDPSVSLGFLK